MSFPLTVIERASLQIHQFEVGKHHDQEAPKSSEGYRGITSKYILSIIISQLFCSFHLVLWLQLLSNTPVCITINLLKLQLMELFTIWPWSSGLMKQKSTQKSPLWFFWRWQKFRKKDIVRKKRKEKVPQLWGSNNCSSLSIRNKKS